MKTLKFAGLKRFWRDKSANIAIIFAFGSTALIGAVGGAVDYSRALTVGTQVQSALDSGVLAAASLTQTQTPESVVRSYVEASLQDYPAYIGAMTLSVTSQQALNSRDVSADIVIDVPTTILGVMGIDSIRVERTSSAIEAARNIEISLVLDVSGSMIGSKIDALKGAAADFVDHMLAANPGNTTISVIPYNGSVRVPDYINDTLIDDPSASERQRSGCPEILFHESAALEASGVLDSLLDHLNFLANDILRWDIDLGVNEYAWMKWTGVQMRGNDWSVYCPNPSSESIFLSDNANELKTLINGLSAWGHTGLDIGTAWGVRALDPVWRGRIRTDVADKPSDYDSGDAMKILVVMTDGAATQQYRTDLEAGCCGGPQYYWAYAEVYSASEARNNVDRICDDADHAGVHIYSIAFQVSGQTHKSLLENCATHQDNYYDVDDFAIDQAFSSIAASINSLRLNS